jgi:hypothetical protein
VVVFVNDWQWGSYYLLYKNEQVFEREIGTFVLFYKSWYFSPPFFFLSQTMANRFHRVPTNIHIPWRSAFFLYLFIFGIKQYGRYQIRPLRPHKLKTVSQNEKYFEGFFER